MTKSVFITGTSSGYGKATAQIFLDRGWNVVATMRRPNQAIFHGPAERLLVLPLDITDPDSVSKALTDGIAAFGAIDAIVNNAGIGLMSAFEVTPESALREVFETNTFGLMSVCRAVIPHMRERGKGVIINVTSSAGIAPMPLVAIYTASKWAVEGFSEALSYELGLLGIRVRIVEPGLAPTTNFAPNGAERMQGLMPPPYDAFALDYMDKMRNYPTAYTTEQETAEAVFSAATDDGDCLRYLAGEDTKLLSSLRRTTSEEEYLAKMRKMFGPKLQP